MDMKMQGETSTPTTFPTWDCFAVENPVGSGIFDIPMITGDEEAAQQAQVLVYGIRGMIPQLPGAGNEWLGFLASEVAFGALDSEIRKSLADGGHQDYFPVYNIVNGVLIASAKRSS